MFKFRKEVLKPDNPPQIAIKETPARPRKLSLTEQKKLRKQQKAKILAEFDKPLINLLHNDIWIPLNIIDLQEVEIPESEEMRAIVESAIKEFNTIHRDNLRGKIYRRSLNFQPGLILMVVKDREGDFFNSYRLLDSNLERMLGSFDRSVHRLLLARYFVPPVPDDLYKYDEDFSIPPKFLEVLQQIADYTDENFSLDNVDFDKFDRMIDLLSSYGARLQYSRSEQEFPLTEIKELNCDILGYNRLTVKQTVKETVEKADMIAVPLFILLLALFCSSITENSVFSYHYLFSSTGASKKELIANKSLSFPKLFNRLLDESLLPAEFNQCLIRIYHEVFRPRQEAISDLLEHFRNRYEDLVGDEDEEA
jgi:hypothetical protein